MGEQQQLRARYEEIMQWINPPWDPVSKRVDPRPEAATPDKPRGYGIHVDQVSQVCMRWSVLEMGAMPTFRVKPPYVEPALPIPGEPPEQEAARRRTKDIEALQARNKSTQMENLVDEWQSPVNAALHRTLLWASWAKRAFGVAVLRTGWDPVEKIPTCELIENPSQVYRGWTRRDGRRMLQWVNVAEQMSPEEARYRFDIPIPTRADGTVDMAGWAGPDSGALDARPEQQGTVNSMIWAEEYWELQREPGLAPKVVMALIVGGRVIDGPHTYPWRRLPFRVVENEHIPTYQHSKSTAEAMIPLNHAYDDMLDRQHKVIEFEAGPRYKGLNMFHTKDEVSVPGPFQMIPLREGEDIVQIDTRVDFFPTQLHANELKESVYDSTGLTPIAWGRSPNAQTSGRALSAEWRAVELPLASAIINWTPEIIDIYRDWFDFAEEYDDEVRDLVKDYRRFQLIWEPLDIRDATERTLDVIQRLQNNIIDPELAMELTGIENPEEVMARIKAYLVDPIYNPLRYQQLLILKQLTLQIQMQEAEMAAMQEQQGAQQPQQGQQPQPSGVPAGQMPAPGQGPVTEAQNQPGMSPNGGGLPVEVGLLSRTPLEGGSGNQITATVGSGIPIG